MPSVVTVACKLPHGLNLGPFVEGGPDVVLNGYLAGDKRSVGGFGLTPNVDKDGFEKWLNDHKGFTPVTKGLIFTNDREAMVLSEASEKAGLKSGFEGVDPDKPAQGIEPDKDAMKGRTGGQ
ncbi:MAG: hypothetical protein ACYDD1_04705 [Caulobacteraceae bacterium]